VECPQIRSRLNSITSMARHRVGPYQVAARKTKLRTCSEVKVGTKESGWARHVPESFPGEVVQEEFKTSGEAGVDAISLICLWCSRLNFHEPLSRVIERTSGTTWFEGDSVKVAIRRFAT
jgi:hypothetical protein